MSLMNKFSYWYVPLLNLCHTRFIKHFVCSAKACDLAKSALETPEEKVNELPEEQAKER